jgi:hypothetical protein
MQYPVIVRSESANQYVAQPLGIPELRVVAATEAEAIEQVSHALSQWLASAKVVQVSVPVVGSGNPWLDTFGRSANDPDFDEFLEELKRARSTDASS